MLTYDLHASVMHCFVLLLSVEVSRLYEQYACSICVLTQALRSIVV